MNPHLSYNQILELVDTFDVLAYAKNRNHLHGTVSKLSPYITRGVISLPIIRDRILARYSYEQAEKFIQELAWREYFQKVWTAQGEAIFSDLRFTRDDWAHTELIRSITQGKTGITVIDNQLQGLFETGYMHNHARMWTAMLACNVGKAHWLEMGRFLYYHLLDGDLASNMLSWQWVAGTNASKCYIANQKLIDGCSDTLQPGTYLDVPLEQIGTTMIPASLLQHEPFSYTTIYPPSDVIENIDGKTLLLYHPWSLDPLWRSSEVGMRILVIEPRLFDRFPVSLKVMHFIIMQATVHIPNIKIYVGNIEKLPGIQQATTICSKRYAGTTHWPGVIDIPDELFPEVTGYFSSFFKFWQACEKTR